MTDLKDFMPLIDEYNDLAHGTAVQFCRKHAEKYTTEALLSVIASCYSNFLIRLMKEMGLYDSEKKFLDFLRKIPLLF